MATILKHEKRGKFRQIQTICQSLYHPFSIKGFIKELLKSVFTNTYSVKRLYFGCFTYHSRRGMRDTPCRMASNCISLAMDWHLTHTMIDKMMVVASWMPVQMMVVVSSISARMMAVVSLMPARMMVVVYSISARMMVVSSMPARMMMVVSSMPARGLKRLGIFRKISEKRLFVGVGVGKMARPATTTG